MCFACFAAGQLLEYTVGTSLLNLVDRDHDAVVRQFDFDQCYFALGSVSTNSIHTVSL